MTTVSVKMLDFEGSKGPKIVQNRHPGGFKIKNFQNNNCKAAAESILEALGWKRGRAVAGQAECARPVIDSFKRFIRLIRLTKPRLTRPAPARGAPYLIDCPRGAPPPPHFFCHLCGYRFLLWTFGIVASRKALRSRVHKRK